MLHAQIPPSHLAVVDVQVGSVAAEAEYHNRTKYQELDSMYIFIPIAIKISGAFSPAAAAVFTDLGKQVAESWRNPGHTPFYFGM